MTLRSCPIFLKVSCLTGKGFSYVLKVGKLLCVYFFCLCSSVSSSWCHGLSVILASPCHIHLCFLHYLLVLFSLFTCVCFCINHLCFLHYSLVVFALFTCVFCIIHLFCAFFTCVCCIIHLCVLIASDSQYCNILH